MRRSPPSGSGAGKSTLVDLVLGLLPPTAGRVTVDGFDIQHNLRGWQDIVGYVPQSVYLLDEAKSSLDMDTEREVMAAVEALHGTKTLVIVAHRLSTVEKCDVLHRIEDGTIVRSGSFAEVVAGSPR